MESTFTDEQVRIVDLVTATDPALHGVCFERCRITGPALLLLQDCLLDGNDYGADADSILWTIAPWQRSVAGAVSVRDCEFRECEFVGVAFVGYEHLTSRLRLAMAG